MRVFAATRRTFSTPLMCSSGAKDSHALVLMRLLSERKSQSGRCTITSRAKTLSWRPYFRSSTGWKCSHGTASTTNLRVTATHDRENVRRSICMVVSTSSSGSGFSRLAMELADLPGHPGRVIVRHHKAAVEARFAEMLAIGNVDSPELRARQLWLIVEGAMNCILFHGDPSYAETAKSVALKVITHPLSQVRNGKGRRKPTKPTKG